MNPFSPLLTSDERNRLYAMTAALDFGDSPWFLYAGALLGCVLFGDLLPWDDDIDILCDDPMGVKVYPYSFVQTRFGSAMEVSGKVFDPSRPFIDGRDYSFPFIDIAAFVYDGTVNHGSSYGGVDSFPREAIFPLRRAKLGPIDVNIPNDPEYVLTAKYGDWKNTATPPKWDHRRECFTEHPQDRVPLTSLLPSAPESIGHPEATR